MLRKKYFYHNPSTNPHETLALEEVMLNRIKQDEIILYLYSHTDSVIIGRNQNVWSECRHEKLISDGGTLARRISGGGAVYHDIGNLNFSFIVGKKNYDQLGQTNTILEAVRTFGVPAEFSGRNDLVLQDGRKFSGNAFCSKKNGCIHHGTLMIDTDVEKMDEYLTVSKDKIQSKSIPSVRARVANLSDVSESITVSSMAKALKLTFEDIYGKRIPYILTEDVKKEVNELAARNASWNWLFGKSPKFDISIKNRYSFGMVELLFSLSDARITDATVYSDANDADFIEELPKKLVGCKFASSHLADKLGQGRYAQEQREMIDELVEYILRCGY
ncbi:MAG: lipoate--protein ligase [Christensenellaceae bacterium]|jgi:lipoate-protein ligase A